MIKAFLHRVVARVARFLHEDDYCDCLDPWTCGRPHLDDPTTAQNPIAIDGLAPLSELEEAAFLADACPRCERAVFPHEWKRKYMTMECLHCGHLVDPA